MSYPEGISRNRAANVEMSRYQAKMAGLSGDVVVDKRKQQQQEEEGPPQPKKMSLNWLCKFFMEGGSAACRNGANVSPLRAIALHAVRARLLARVPAGLCAAHPSCPPILFAAFPSALTRTRGTLRSVRTHTIPRSR